MTRSRSALRAVGAAVAASLAMVSFTPSAHAVEAYTAPSGGAFTIAGHGYGHGIGMSQWGAFGAAVRGLSMPQIIGFYYPGTSLTTFGNPLMRIRLDAIGGGGTQVISEPGLTVIQGSASIVLPAKDTKGVVIDRWRVVRSGTALALQRRSGGVWATDLAMGGTSPIAFSNGSRAVVRAVLPSGNLRDYRGQLRTHLVSSSTQTINLVSMDAYLQSVVPSEMPASWAPAALEAQAVAARSYAASDAAAKSGSSIYDTCDTTSCQVYSGIGDFTAAGTPTVSHEYASSTTAVRSTAYRIASYGGQPAFTQFSASNGGWTVTGSRPYLVAKADPYDGGPYTGSWAASSTHSWSTTVSVAAIQAAFPTTGTFSRLEIPGRNGLGDLGGRVTSIRVVGSKGSETVTGATFRSRLGLRSDWFAPTTPPAPPTPPVPVKPSAAAFPRDVSGDGRADLLAVTAGSGQLTVFKGNGAGGFAGPAIAGYGWGPLTSVVSAGPWDADPHGDLIARRADGTLWLYPGAGTGAFTKAPRQIGAGWNAFDTIIAPGDFDGDGYNDLLARRAGNGDLVLYPGNGTGGFKASRVVGWGWQGFRSIIATGDFTGDGKPDVLALRSSDQRLLVYRGDGRGAWLGSSLVTSGWGGFDALTGPGDVTGDGNADLLARRKSDGALMMYAGTGVGTVLAPKVVGTGWSGYSRIVP